MRAPLGRLTRHWWGGWTFGPVCTRKASCVAVWAACREAGRAHGIPDHAWTAKHNRDAWMYVTCSEEDFERRERARKAKTAQPKNKKRKEEKEAPRPAAQMAFAFTRVKCKKCD